MKNVKWIVAIVLASVLTQYVNAAKEPFNSDEERLSYTIGYDLGTNFKRQGIEISPKVILQGLEDSIQGKALKLTKEQMANTLKKFQEKIMAKKRKEFQEKAERNKKLGETFLNKNKGKKGVKVTKSGLQYQIINAGNKKAKSPSKNDFVEVEYTGKLINGTVFDSSKSVGKPVRFKVSEVITGWSEALKMMKPGAKWKIVVPSNLAYGERGVGGPIGPNETLIFDIHLISIHKKDVEPT